MKKVFIFVVSSVLFTFCIFANGWNSSVTVENTNSWFYSIDNFTNKDGIHIIRMQTGSPFLIKYQLLNSSGSIVRSSTLETGSVGSPVITGDNSNIYAVYFLNDPSYPYTPHLKIKKSTNAGANWTDPSNNTVTLEGLGNSIDALLNSSGIHVVYSADVSGTKEVYYRLYNFSSNDWTDTKNVTDEGSGGVFGRDPSIAISSYAIHVTFSLDNEDYSTGVTRSRDKLFSNNTWQASQAVSGDAMTTMSSAYTDNTYLYVVYHSVNTGNWTTPIKYTKRSVSGSTWDSPYTLNDNGVQLARPQILKTTNGEIHTCYTTNVNGPDQTGYRKYNGSWQTEELLSTGDVGAQQGCMSSVNNDVFVTWLEGYSSPEDLLYRQFDAEPSLPTAMSIGSPNQVTVNWSWNPEPDINNYEVWRKYYRSRFDNQDWTLMASPTTNSWTDPDFQLNSMGDHYTVYYKTRSKDKTNQLSGYSSEISTDAVMVFSKKGNLTEQVAPTQYNLEQNYPNPFNPTTTIDYSIPEASNVHIAVFDYIGREVAIVVNKNQNAGYYSATFDASKLPSGVYFYAIKAGRFSSTKKMMLVK